MYYNFKLLGVSKRQEVKVLLFEKFLLFKIIHQWLNRCKSAFPVQSLNYRMA